MGWERGRWPWSRLPCLLSEDGYYLLSLQLDSPLWMWLVVSTVGGASAGLFSLPCTKMVMSCCQ